MLSSGRRRPGWRSRPSHGGTGSASLAKYEIQPVGLFQPRVRTPADGTDNVLGHILLEELTEGLLVLPPDEDSPVTVERSGRRKLLCEVHEQFVGVAPQDLGIFRIVS